MNEKNILLTKIKKYDFAIKELNLYLDTHPKCRRALALYSNYTSLRREAVSEYTAKFGPLTPDANTDPLSWNWISDPWPWERS